MRIVKIEVFSSPGCSKCGRAKDMLKKIATEEAGNAIQWREVNILEEMEYTIDLGVLSTPAIAIDGELVFSGLPSKRKLKETLARRLEGKRESLE